MKTNGPTSGAPGQPGAPQGPSNLVYLAGATIDPLAVQGRPGFAPPNANSGQHIVQLNVHTSAAFKSQIEKAAGRVIGYLPDNAYLVRAKGPSLAAVKKLPFVRATLAMPPQFKVDTTLRSADGKISLLAQRS